MSVSSLLSTDSSSEINTRIRRERIMVDEQVIRLYNVKKYLVTRTTPSFEKINLTYFLNHPSTKNYYEKHVYYLHFLIIFKEPRDVEYFLNEHTKKYGEYATKMLVNFPLISPTANNVVTALMCCAHWTNTPDMARILYQWGADFSLMDLNRKYPEETYGGPYYNHLVDYIGQGCFVIGYRSKRDFVDVAHEILYLAGERKPPDGWMPPNKMVQSVG